MARALTHLAELDTLPLAPSATLAPVSVPKSKQGAGEPLEAISFDEVANRYFAELQRNDALVAKTETDTLDGQPTVEADFKGLYPAILFSKPNKNLGWSLVGPTSAEGTDLDECVKGLASALAEGPLALGFEAPMYVPVRSAPDRHTKARSGECRDGVNRPFSASPCSTVTVAAMEVVPYVLAGLRRLVPTRMASLDWKNFSLESHGLLLFEAFGTNQKKKTDTMHVEDARLAANDLFERLSSGFAVSSALDEPSCFSLLGAMTLRTGWSKDPNVVSEECLVVRP